MTQLVGLFYLGDEVDGHTLAPESAGTPYTVDVVLAVSGKVVVDDQRHLKYSRSKRQTARDGVRGAAACERPTTITSVFTRLPRYLVPPVCDLTPP